MSTTIVLLSSVDGYNVQVLLPDLLTYSKNLSLSRQMQKMHGKGNDNSCHFWIYCWHCLQETVQIDSGELR